MAWLVLWAQSTSKDYIRAEHKLHSVSKLFISQVIIPQVMFLNLFIFRGHSAREPASSRVAYVILRAYTGTGVSHSKHRKNSGEILEKKNAGKWTKRVEVRKKSLAVSVAYMSVYWPTSGFKRRTFKLCVLRVRSCVCVCVGVCVCMCTCVCVYVCLIYYVCVTNESAKLWGLFSLLSYRPGRPVQ